MKVKVNLMKSNLLEYLIKLDNKQIQILTYTCTTRANVYNSSSLKPGGSKSLTLAGAVAPSNMS